MSDASSPNEIEPNAAATDDNSSSLRQRKSTREERNQALAAKVASIKSRRSEAERWQSFRSSGWKFIKPFFYAAGAALAAVALYWLIYHSPVFELDESLYDADGDAIIDVEDNII